MNSAALTIAAAAAIKASGIAQDADRLNKMPMKTYRIPHTDLTVSRIAYGCSDLGGSSYDKPLDADDRASAERLVHTAYEHGINLFDHADIYRFGKSEEVFGEVLNASPGFRHKLVLQSKCGQVLPPGWKRGQPTHVDLTREHIVKSAEGSLQRLATDRLDILLLHASSTLVEPEEVAKAFDDLHRSGKVRYFGVSNYTATQIQLLKKALRQPLVANQIHLALGYADALLDGSEFTVELYQAEGDDRYMGITGAGTFDYCRLQDIQIQAWRPLRALLKPKPESPPELKAIMQKLTELAEVKRSSPSAVALAWLLHHPAHIVPVIGAGTPEHIVDNCAADRVTLSDDEWYDLLVATADIKARAVRHPS
jgi:predicted oxidoreductase